MALCLRLVFMSPSPFLTDTDEASENDLEPSSRSFDETVEIKEQ